MKAKIGSLMDADWTNQPGVRRGWVSQPVECILHIAHALNTNANRIENHKSLFEKYIL